MCVRAGMKEPREGEQAKGWGGILERTRPGVRVHERADASVRAGVCMCV